MGGGLHYVSGGTVNLVKASESLGAFTILPSTYSIFAEYEIRRQLLHGPRFDQPVSEVTAQGLSWLMADHRGSIVEIRDATGET